MCKIVVVQNGTDEFDCDNHGELAEALGGAPLYIPHPDGLPEPEPEPNSCLCGFDAPATAAKYGYVVGPKDAVWGDITLTKVHP